MPGFIVLALPRSRTAWLSRFLTYGSWVCGHEQMLHARSMDDVKAWFTQADTGTIETLGAPWWRALDTLSPGIRVVTLRRPVCEVVDSLMRAGVFTDRAAATKAMTRLDRKLDQVEKRVPGVLSVSFSDLATEAGCARVFEHCLGVPHDPSWWSWLAPQNIQINLLGMYRYFKANESALKRLTAIAKHNAIAEISKAAAVEPDELSLRVETWGALVEDGKEALREHLVAIGEAPEDYLLKNHALAYALEDNNALQVVTARSNGRIFGYLVTIVGPDGDCADSLLGQHTVFYASPEFPGLGMKLQKFARDALRERGVSAIIFRAGMRGDGDRISALYRRIGARPFGQLFRLDL